MAYSVREESFASLEEEWQRLLPHCSSDNIFLTPQWQKVWWQEFGQGNELLLMSVRSGSELIGIAPLMSRGGTVYFLGDHEICDCLDFAAVRGEESQIYKAVLDYLAPLDWRSLDLHSLSSESPTLSLFTALAKSSDYSVKVKEEDVCPVLDLPATWEEYLAQLTKKDRHELRRRLRRLSQKEFCYYVADDGACLAEDMEDFLSLHKKSGEAKDRFMTPRMSRFFRNMASCFMEQGYLRLFFLEVDGVRVATAMCFDYRDEILLYNSGYDPDYASLSVGLLLKVFCIKEAIARGKRRFDFLRGAEPYKYDLGGQDRSVNHLLVQRRG